MSARADSYEIRRLLKSLAYAAESSVGHFAFWDELRGGSRELDEYDVKHVQLIVDMVHALAERAGIDVTEGSTENGAHPEVDAALGASVFRGDLKVETSELLDRLEEEPGAVGILLGNVIAQVDELERRAGTDQDGDRPIHGVVNRKQEREAVLQHGGEHLFKGSKGLRQEPEGCGGLAGADVEHAVNLSHSSSLSAGEGAEPGLANTASVEGEPVAGGPFAKSPAATPHGREINPAALRSIRELAGVKSGDLARAAEISHGFLSNIEAGRKQPSPAVTRQLARRLGVPIDAITQTA